MLLEAVPNVSLGPQDEALEPVLDAVEETTSPGCRLLDVHTDADHRRTVLTLAGAGVPLTRVLTRLADALLEHASLAGHEGVHPRVGLLDVVPVVPLAAPWWEAERVAHRVVDRLARRGIPVYRYGLLADRDETVELASVRGGLEGTGPGDPAPLAPDRGPDLLHERAGASCVGVRRPLVAYNVVLDTTQTDVGRRIASAIRETDGGLEGVQALAFPLASRGGRIQVSTNITDVQARTPADVYAAVEGHARREGVDVLEGELVGLAPRASLPEDGEAVGTTSVPASIEERLTAQGLPARLDL